MIGHVVGSASHCHGGNACAVYQFVYKAIYLFHMPAFFWIVGACWKNNRVPFGEFVRKRAARLLVPYVIFGVLSSVIFSAGDAIAKLKALSIDGYYARLDSGMWWKSCLSLIHAGGWPNGEGFRCNSVLWFLPCMFTTQLAYYWIDREIGSSRVQVALAAALLVGYFFCQKAGAVFLPWGASLVPWYMPFVILGRWVPILIPENLKQEHRGKVSSLLVLGWIGWGCTVYYMPNRFLGRSEFCWYLAFLQLTVSGVLLSAYAAQLFSGCRAALLAALGTSSLGIMVVHKFIILALQLKVPPICSALQSGGGRSFVVVGGIILITTLVSFFFANLPIVRKIL